MRLGLQLLNNSATVNSIQRIPFMRIANGETVDIYFQLIDLDQSSLRYIPDPTATVNVVIPRALQVSSAPLNSRITNDNTISRAAIKPFSGDASIWKLTLLANESANLIGNSITVTVTEPSSVKIATLTSAIKIIDNQDQ